MMRLSVWASSPLPTLFHRRTVSARLPTMSSLPRRPLTNSICQPETNSSSIQMDLPPAWNDKYLSSLPRRPLTNSICQPQSDIYLIELIEADNNSSVLSEMDLPPENELYLTEMNGGRFF